MKFCDLTIDMPNEFRQDESLVSFTAVPSKNLQTGLAMQKQTPIRPNLTMHRKQVVKKDSLDTITGKMCAEIASSNPDILNLTVESMVFDDGTPGSVIAFDCRIRNVTLRQYQAIRLSHPWLITITLTVDASRITDASASTYLDCLRSCRLTPDASN